MSIEMNRLLILITALAFLFGCNKAESENSRVSPDPKGGLTDDYVEVNEKSPTEISPVGFWETSLLYPRIDAESTPNANAINALIVEFVRGFRCDNGGDQTFTGEIVRIEADTLVMSCESMWKCESMPAPNYEAGTATIDLDNLELTIAKD